MTLTADTQTIEGIAAIFTFITLFILNKKYKGSLEILRFLSPYIIMILTSVIAGIAKWHLDHKEEFENINTDLNVLKHKVSGKRVLG